MTHPRIMGILNATPDSFYDRGAFFSLEKAIARGLEIAQEGADILDIGGESARPGALPVEEKEELARVIPLIDALAPQLSIPLSIDSHKPAVVAAALEKGAQLINDISGFAHPAMREIAASSQADLCIMHMQKNPQTMQLDPHYPEGVIPHILHFFEERISLLLQAGVKESRLILDPGIGFGKTVTQNLELIRSIDRFKSFGLRILIGASRKSFLQKIFNKPACDLLNASVIVHALSVIKGADIVRVHDVQAHREMCTLYQQILV